MARPTERLTVTIPATCRDDVVPVTDPRAEPLLDAGVGQVVHSRLTAGFDWPGPDPVTHLVLVTLSGAGHIEVGGEPSVLSAGTVAIARAGTPRRHWTESEWEVITIRLTADDRWRELGSSPAVVLDSIDVRRFAAPVAGMLAELPDATTLVTGAASGSSPIDTILDRFAGSVGFLGDNESSTAAPTEPFALHATALRIQLEQLRTSPDGVSAEAQRLAALWEDVRRDPAASWTVRDLARRLNVSPATLHRIVSRHHDLTPAAAVERIRMDQAARLLTGGSLPIAAIATQVGYATPFSFSAAFKRHHGVPPSTHRRRDRPASRPSSPEKTETIS